MANAKKSQMMSKALLQRSSVFELPLHRPGPCGSSITSFACEPKHSDHDPHHRQQKKVQFENTYRMEPETRFKIETVQEIIREVLQENLKDKMYDPIDCSLLCKDLAQEIKVKVKALGFARYKIISYVTIGEKKEQGMRCGSRNIWDASRDNFASGNFENTSLCAMATVYAIYYE
ncbi:unnamed protein product [Owenia fusiformis]|uniref:Uncharacterized protein n=1 Tax=Owenia fusiformis TaxID=6347 RepID=A0A8J1TPJ8_OWEFU|nr:unnamed protein product [Owenia fusiformis]